jgi:hypothetical protein
VKPVSLGRVLPPYPVVFIGFVGYSLMITVFTPMILADDGGLLPQSSSISERTLVLGALLALYPLAQFVGSPILGALSDRFGRRPVLLTSLAPEPAAADGGLPAGRTLGGEHRDRPERDCRRHPGGPAQPPVRLRLPQLQPRLRRRFRETHVPSAGASIGLARAFANVGAAFAPGRLRPLFLANFTLYLAIFGFFRVYPIYLVDLSGWGSRASRSSSPGSQCRSSSPTSAWSRSSRGGWIRGD